MLVLLFAVLCAARADDGHVVLHAGPSLAAGAPQLAAGVRVVGDKDAWVGVEGRLATQGTWTARASTGIDLLGRSPLDLNVGVFVGGAGGGLSLDPGLSVGGVLSAGVEVWRLDARYRLLRGVQTANALDHALAGRLPPADTEHDVTLALRVVDELRVFGQYLRAVPASGAAWQAIGGGLSVSF